MLPSVQFCFHDSPASTLPVWISCWWDTHIYFIHWQNCCRCEWSNWNVIIELFMSRAWADSLSHSEKNCSRAEIFSAAVFFLDFLFSLCLRWFELPCLTKVQNVSTFDGSYQFVICQLLFKDVRPFGCEIWIKYKTDINLHQWLLWFQEPSPVILLSFKSTFSIVVMSRTILGQTVNVFILLLMTHLASFFSPRDCCFEKTQMIQALQCTVDICIFSLGKRLCFTFTYALDYNTYSHKSPTASQSYQQV